MLRRKKKQEPKPSEDMGLRCPGCNCADTPVQYTRKVMRGVRRVRRCRHCGRRFSTYERS